MTKVVLVEDNDAHAMLVERCIELVNPDVDVVRIPDGERALEYLCDATTEQSSENHDDAGQLMLLDLRLPRVGGLDVLRELKSRGIPRAMPIVVLSSSDSEHDVTQANEIGVDGYLVKPYDFEELQESIRQLMERFDLV